LFVRSALYGLNFDHYDWREKFCLQLRVVLHVKNCRETFGFSQPVDFSIIPKLYAIFKTSENKNLRNWPRLRVMIILSGKLH